ncbi:hypothetical protein FB645_002845 [Coemansia sp. IMI 203386]|nr:hypothetical protein FB645_002845 [Coemansia sp. IMI 203386]
MATDQSTGIWITIAQSAVRAQQGNNRNVVYGEYEGGFHVFQSSPFGAVGSTQAWMQVREFAQSLKQPYMPLSSLT